MKACFYYYAIDSKTEIKMKAMIAIKPKIKINNKIVKMINVIIERIIENWCASAIAATRITMLQIDIVIMRIVPITAIALNSFTKKKLSGDANIQRI